MKNFVSPHVHVHSLDSASTPEQFARRELELGTGYLTVTDHGTMEATRHVYELTKDKKFKDLKPILGLEGYHRDDSCEILTAAGVQKSADGTFRDAYKYGHITLHCLDEDGYRALSRTLSDADLRAEKHGSERKPLFTWANLEYLGSHNVTATSGCLIGMVSRHLVHRNDPQTAIRYYERLRSTFKPGNFYVEVFPHVCSHNWDSGVFVEAPGVPERKFQTWKNLKTRKGAIKADQLAKDFLRNPEKARKEHVEVLEVMENRAWKPLEAPLTLWKVEAREGFIQNECRPWAPGGDLQYGVNQFLIRMAKKYGDPILVSDDSHFAYPEEKVVQDIRLGQNGNWKFANSYHRMSGDEGWVYFRDVLGIDQATYEGWTENSYTWANRFRDFKFGSRKTLPASFYPKDTLRHTMELIKRRGRMDWSKPEYVERLKAEINLLYKNGTIDMLPYFMIDQEVVELYIRNGELPGPGRGSAAGMSIAYNLGITHADPLRWKLSMDRFMTLDRIQSGKYPDIDQDLPHRNLLVDPEDSSKGWLRDRFGDCQAQISTDITLKLKNSIKDVFRATYGFVAPEIEAICKALPNPPQGIPDRDYVFGYKDNDDQWNQGLIETDATLQHFVKTYPKEWDIVKMLIGMPKTRGRHACGFVISDEPIQDFIPMTTIGDVRCASFTAAGVEAAGGLKMDFLVVNVLNDIRDAMRLVQDRVRPDINWKQARLKDSEAPKDRPIPGETINGLFVPHVMCLPFEGGFVDIWDLPERSEVFRDICDGKVETVFQFDAGAARQGLRNFRPEGDTLPLKGIEGLAAFTALDRPGPLDARVKTTNGDEHNMLVEFAIRARGGDRSGALEVLDKMIAETNGVIVYQEQLQAIFQEVGGTTAIQANNFRQRISKKKMVEVNKTDKPLFMKGAVAKLGQETADILWDMMQTFGQYGFNKSHAVCYVIIGYACAFLKHFYPLEWWAAVLSNAERNEVNEKFWRYCGPLVLMPDVQKSQKGFVIEGNRIRAPLSLLKGLGDKAHAQLLAGAPYSDIEDLLLKIEAHRQANSTTVQSVNAEGVTVLKTRKGTSALNDTVLRNLVLVGALDSLFPTHDTDGLPMTSVDRLKVLDITAAKVRGKKAPKAGAGRYNLESALVQYQVRKQILPAYSEPLRPLVQEFGPRLREDSFISAGNPETGSKPEVWRLIDGHQFEYLESLDILPPGDVQVAVLAYVVGTRKFDYTKKDTGEAKTALELQLDVDGVRMQVVKWPGKTGLSRNFLQPLDGAVIVCLFSRSNGSSTFFLADVEVASPPLKANTEVQNAEASP